MTEFSHMTQSSCACNYEVHKWYVINDIVDRQDDFAFLLLTTAAKPCPRDIIMHAVVF